MENTISVIIPTYNREFLLKKAVDSVLSQTFKNFELIVVDDGSNDNSKELIENYMSSSEHEIKYIKLKNLGPAAARNRGIKESRYGLIAFLDSDDWFDKNKLAVQIDAMRAMPKVMISHTNEIWYRNGRLLNQKLKHLKSRGNIFDRCLQMCVVSMSTVMVRKELFSDIGLFNEDFQCCEDFDFWLRASVRNPFMLIDQPLTLKDGGRDDQVSNRHRVGMDKYRIKAITNLLEFGELSEDQYKLAINELKNKCQIYGNGCIKHGKEEEGRAYLELPDKFNK